MNTPRLFLALVVAACAVTVHSQSSDPILRDKVTNAVMKVYDDHLAQNPKDYNTLFARAHQNYYNGDYIAALADVNQAMLLTPKSDKDLRFDEHILRARISEARMDFSSELADLRLAQEIKPKSLACTDMIAKANLRVGNLEAAEKAFKTILQAESMNYDAMYGMAQVELARKNDQEAIKYVDKAVSLFRTEPQVYVNRSDIYARQGNMYDAVSDLLQGMSVGDGGIAVQRLFELSDADYNGVMRSLTELTDKMNDSGVFRYLRANIAMDHNRYGQALKELNYIKRNNLYISDMLYYNMAKCCLELTRYEDALNYAYQALSMNPSHPDSYVVRALAEYNLDSDGDILTAMQTLELCSERFPQHVPMLLTKAELLMSKGFDKKALGYLNAAVANEPGNAEALLTRAMLLQKLGNAEVAAKDYNTLTYLTDEPQDLKGVAYSVMERDNDAFKWLQNVTSNVLPGGENCYYAAVFMALRGDNYNALKYLQKALDNGYGSLYKLQGDVLSTIGLKSLRSEKDFKSMIDRAQLNFVEMD